MASQYELNESTSLDDDNDVDIDDNEEIQTDVKGKPSEDLSIASRERVRMELQAQIEAFLVNGGRVHEIPSRVEDASRPSKLANVDSSLLI